MRWGQAVIVTLFGSAQRQANVLQDRLDLGHHRVSSWRDALTSIADVSAASVFPRNLITDDGQSEAVEVAAMSASAFRVARVLPLLGRTLVEADEDPGAPPVLLIGHDICQRGAVDVRARGHA